MKTRTGKRKESPRRIRRPAPPRRSRSRRSPEGTLIFFESPRRLAASLEAMYQVLGDREAALCRELTKTHETIYRAVLSGLHKFVLSDTNQQRGEVVILVRGFDPATVTLTPETSRLLARLADELPPRRAAGRYPIVMGDDVVWYGLSRGYMRGGGGPCVAVRLGCELRLARLEHVSP